MMKLTVEFDCCLASLVEFFGFCHDTTDFLQKGFIWLKADYKLEVMLVTKVVHFGCTIIVVSANQDTHFRPGLPDSLNEALQDGDDFFARRFFAGSENGGNQSAAFAFINVQRQVAEAIVIGIKKR